MKKSIVLVLLLALFGCSRSPNMEAGSQRSGMVPAPKLSNSAAGNKQADPATRRHLALKHQLTLLVPAATLAQDFAAIQAECIKLGCEILSAGQEAPGARHDANATLSARVPPDAFAGFFSGIERRGKLLSHQSQSEDKTADVIDIEARIGNLEALKARLLELLAKRTGSLKDVLEAEKALAETQSALDGIRGQRRVLASQTEMVKIDIELRPDSVVNEGSWTAPVVVAAHEAGAVLMGSVAFLLTTSVALLPWVLVLAVLSLLVRRLWRKWRAKH